MIRALIGLFSTRCPYCKSIDFRSVGIRNEVDKVLQCLLHPYRCSLCGRHFFLFGLHAAPESTA